MHRDVSLSNIMIGYEGGVKLIDFGIAKSANRATKTVAGTLKGKFGYLSPEQVLRQPVDHRTDIFALGIVLYELTTMERAFLGTSELITLERITKGDYTPPIADRRELSAGARGDRRARCSIDPDRTVPDRGRDGARDRSGRARDRRCDRRPRDHRHDARVRSHRR